MRVPVWWGSDKHRRAIRWTAPVNVRPSAPTKIDFVHLFLSLSLRKYRCLYIFCLYSAFECFYLMALFSVKWIAAVAMATIYSNFVRGWLIYRRWRLELILIWMCFQTFKCPVSHILCGMRRNWSVRHPLRGCKWRHGEAVKIIKIVDVISVPECQCCT